MRIRVERLWRQIRVLLRRDEYDRELAEELEFHLAMKRQEKQSRGLDSKLASEVAQRELGNLTQAKENSREAWTFQHIESVGKDLRFAFRVLLKSPVFTACAVLTLALGIGANASIFTLIDTLLLRGLPGPHPDRILQLTIKGDEPLTYLTYPLFEDVKQRAHNFSGVFTWNSADLWVRLGRAGPVDFRSSGQWRSLPDARTHASGGAAFLALGRRKRCTFPCRDQR